MNQIERCSFPLSRDAAFPSPVCRDELPTILPLRHGGIAETKLRYELVGQPGAPLLIVAGGISAGRHVVASSAFPEAGWWQSQAGTFDLAGYRVLAIDWIGADGALDLPIDPADQAEAIRHLLDYLEIERAAAFIGASYGAMVGMHFAANHEDRLGGLLAISASNASHPFTSACRALQRQAIRLGEERGDPEAGVALARALAILTYRTPEEFAERFAAMPRLKDGRLRVGAEDYLDAQGARHCRRMTAIAYRRLSESIDLHRIDPAAITVPLTLVAVDLDWLVTPADIQAFADQVAGANYHLITSHYGHDAFLKEEAQVAAIITQFVNSVEISK
jgi:homoserine O-acetyltransferase/O-succinyltransferase